MSIRPTSRRNGGNGTNLWQELVEIISKYKEIAFQTHELLQDSKEYIEYRWVQGTINHEVYERRLQNLVNMALLYYYGLYEGFTRQVLFTMEVRYGPLKKGAFEKIFFKFNDLNRYLLKEKYGVYLPKHQFKIVKILREARNSIIHEGKNAKPDFRIIEECNRTVTGYFTFLVSQLQRK